MEKEKRFEKITIDLRPFGWGIRDVDVIWPEGHDCKCEEGPDAGQGGGMDEDEDDPDANGGGEQEQQPGFDANADDGAGDV